jgi:hypothetical protein
MGRFHPLEAVIVGSVQAEAFDMLVSGSGDLGKSPPQLWERKIDGIVLDILAKTVDGLEKNIDLSQIAEGPISIDERRR